MGQAPRWVLETGAEGPSRNCEDHRLGPRTGPEMASRLGSCPRVSEDGELRLRGTRLRGTCPGEDEPRLGEGCFSPVLAAPPGRPPRCQPPTRSGPLARKSPRSAGEVVAAPAGGGETVGSRGIPWTFLRPSQGQNWTRADPMPAGQRARGLHQPDPGAHADDCNSFPVTCKVWGAPGSPPFLTVLCNMPSLCCLCPARKQLLPRWAGVPHVCRGPLCGLGGGAKDWGGQRRR